MRNPTSGSEAKDIFVLIICAAAAPFLMVLVCAIAAYATPLLLLVAVIAILCPRQARYAFCWMLAYDYPTPSRKGETGIMELVTIFIFGVTQGAALLISERKAIEFRPGVLGLYIAVTVPTLGMVVGVLRARAKNAAEKQHLYNAGTVRFGRCTFVALAVIVIGYLVAYGFQLAKEPQLVELEIENYEHHNFEYDKKQKIVGIKFFSHITPIEFQRLGYVTNPRVDVVLSRDLYKDWSISAVNADLASTKQPNDSTEQNGRPKKQPADPPPTQLNKKAHFSGSSRTLQIQFNSLTPSTIYDLTFYLHPRGKDPAQLSDTAKREQTLSRLKKERLIRIYIRPPESSK